MRYKFFAVAVLDPEPSEAEVNAFLAQHRILSVDRKLIETKEASYWSLCVSYLDPAHVKSEGTALKKARVDFRELLSESDFAIYAQLRTLRKEMAESAGVPPYC